MRLGSKLIFYQNGSENGEIWNTFYHLIKSKFHNILQPNFHYENNILNRALGKYLTFKILT